MWKFGLLGTDFAYRPFHRYPNCAVAWETCPPPGEPGAPAFGRAEKVYNVIDVRQSYLQEVVKEALAVCGFAREAGNSVHFAYEMVSLSEKLARQMGAGGSGAVAMSGRKGIGVKADDLLDALVAKARAEIEARDPERPAEAKQRSAEAIAVGALRYFMLKFGRNRIITFDMDEALAFVGETGPYVQNSIVRARNIFAKMRAEGHDVSALLARARALPLDDLLRGEEGDLVWALLMMIARSEEVLEQVVADEEVAALARHAFAISQAFHSYYQKPQHSLLHAPSDELRAFRVLVVDAFLRQMEALAALLGIPIPERM